MNRFFSLLILFPIVIGSCSENGDPVRRYTGVVDARTVRVSSLAVGSLVSLSCDEGSSHAIGDTLCTIDTEKLGYQLEQQDATASELDHQMEGLHAQIAAATAQRNNLQIRFARLKAMLSENAATQQAVDDVKAQLDAASEQTNALAASLEALRSKRSQLAAGRKVVTRQVSDAIVRAPLTGTVLTRYIDQGEVVSFGTPICEMADLSEVWTKIYIEEKRLGQIRLNQAVKIKVDGIDDREFGGTITWISPRSEFTPKTILTEETRTTLVYAVKVTIPNRDGIFKIGMPITVLL